MKHYLATAMLVFSSGACGGSDLEPGAGNDPGQGTSTLQVEGSVRAWPRLDNARSRGDFDVDISVRVYRNGQNVSDAAVTVTTLSTVAALEYQGDARWTTSLSGYDEVYVLDVVTGEDNLLDVRVDGPDPHWFVSPAPGETIDTTLALEVEWDADDGADTASIRAKMIDDVAILDSGSYVLAGSALEAKTGEPVVNELRLRRTNRLLPRGAAAGSTFSVQIDNEIEVVAQPL